MGCATEFGSSELTRFERPPENFASAADLSKREAASKLPCNSDGAKPVERPLALLPSGAIRIGRTGYVRFIFDLDDAGGVTNLRIREATEERFIPPSLTALDMWKYEEKYAGEPAAKRKNICSSMHFNINDERGRLTPTWRDVETQTAAYEKYKAYLERKIR